MRIVAVIAVLAGFIAYPVAQAEVSGASVSRTVSYRADLQVESEAGEPCSFSISLDPVLFGLHTLQGKYRVVRILVSNRSGKPVTLSPRADRLKVRLHDGREVDAILNMQQADPTIWDRLSDEVRRALAYPKSIPAGDESAVGRGSQVAFFVFLPVEVADPPKSFELSIDSLHRSVVIDRPPATAA